jgi:hypothetical protein
MLPFNLGKRKRTERDIPDIRPSTEYETITAYDLGWSRAFSVYLSMVTGRRTETLYRNPSVALSSK